MFKFIRKGFLLVLILIFSTISILGCESTGPKGAEKLNNGDLIFNDDLYFKIDADRPPTPTREILTKYKECGFTHFILGEDDFPFTDSEGNINKRYLDAIELCEDLGLKVYIRNFYADPDYFTNEEYTTKNVQYLGFVQTYDIPKRNITVELSSYNAVDGYYMCDEPMYDQIDSYSKLVNWFNEYGKGLFHFNLTGSELGTGLLGGHTYSEYLDKYIDSILKNINGEKDLSIDYYPLQLNSKTHKPLISPQVLGDYSLVAKKVKEYNENSQDENDKLLTNFCIQSFYEPGPWREPKSIYDIRFVVNQAIAFGAKSFEYYLYRGLENGLGIVEYLGQQPREMYDYVKKTNQEAQNLAKAILSFDYNGFKTFEGLQISDENNVKSFDICKDNTLEKFTQIESVECRLDTLISEFIDSNGNIAYFVLNYSEPSLEQTDEVLLNLIGGREATVIIDGETQNKEIENGILDLRIGSGSAAFVYVK